MLWASRKVVSEIFGTTGSNISMHFSNIVSEGELEEMKYLYHLKSYLKMI